MQTGSSGAAASGGLLWLGLQIAKQTPKCLLIVVVFLPFTEVWNKIFADLTGRILARIGIKAFPITQRVEIYNPHREEHLSIFARFSPPRLGDFSFHPFARHAVLRENQ